MWYHTLSERVCWGWGGSPVKPGELMVAHARVIYSSARAVEVLVEVHAEELFTGACRPTHRGRFIFVSADARVSIPRFVPSTPEEQELHAEAVARHEDRRKRKAAAAAAAKGSSGSPPPCSSSQVS